MSIILPKTKVVCIIEPAIDTPEIILDCFAFYNLLQDQDKPVVNAISGFSLERPKTDAQCAGRG